MADSRPGRVYPEWVEVCAAEEVEEVPEVSKGHNPCEPEDKPLPQVAELIWEDQIIISTDMPHAEGRESAVEIITSGY